MILNAKNVEEVNRLLFDFETRLKNIEGTGKKLDHSKLNGITDHDLYVKTDGTVVMQAPLDMGNQNFKNTNSDKLKEGTNQLFYNNVRKSIAWSKADSASTRASIADSKASSAGSQASVAIVDASVAGSEALSAASGASVADSKGESASTRASSVAVNTSIADSKAVAASSSASVADSKAISCCTAGLWTDNSTYISPSNWTNLKLYDAGYMTLANTEYIGWVGGARITGSTTLDFIGAVNMANLTPISFRNAGGTGDINSLYLGATDCLVIGDGLAASKTINLQTDTYFVKTAQFGTYTNSSPLDGQLWYNGTHLYFRQSTTSYQIDQQMVYPGAGIPLSTGSAWGTSITNNSSNWNTAYGWGNHASAGYLTALTGAAILAGASGGQTLYGGTGAEESLNLEGTSHSTDGYVNIVDSTLQLDNNKGIYIKNNAGTGKNMLYLSTSDQLVLGGELGSGKFIVNIDGSLKTLSLAGSTVCAV